MQKTLVTLDDALAHYRHFLEKVALPKIVLGSAYRFNMFERVDWDVKPTVAEDTAPMRAVFLLAYEAMVDLHEQGILNEVRKTVQDPVLDDILNLVPVEGIVPEAELFAERLLEVYGPRTEQRGGALMQIIKPLKALLFLQALAMHPETQGKLTLNSVHFPHRLFRTTEKQTIREIEQEIAEALPLLYSDDLTERVKHITEFVAQDKGKRREFARHGKYRLPQGLWWKPGSTGTEKWMDGLYGSPDVKKDIIYTLASCFALTEQTANEKGKRAKNLPHFSVPPSRYGLASNLMRAYARNQMLSVFKKSGGEAFANTMLTRYTQLTGKIEGDLLVVTDNYYHASERLTQDSSLRPSSYDIPLCVYLLNNFLSTAQEMTSSETS